MGADIRFLKKLSKNFKKKKVNITEIGDIDF